MSNIETVHVIFKTHLDIGFTDLAANVIDQYMNAFIPNALAAAGQLAGEDGPAKFVWTTGSWLIHEYLKRADETDRRKMEEAIARGYIVWHGLPFTTHTELMDPGLFEYGLSISKRLDERFGKKTIAAKMTDVPGHTRGVIGPMAGNGIRYLHLGVNGASKVPGVPEVFVWRGKDGSEIIVNYADNYGNVLELDGLQDAMVFAHTSDNCGPPTVDDIKREFALLSERYPGAVIQASTMDAFAAKLLTMKHLLPIVYEEIGDTWIHGVGTDPKKVAQYRALLRLRNRWVEQGRFAADNVECSEFSDRLLMIPEHTWGMDEKKHLSDYKHYAKADFTAARKADIVTDDAVPDKYRYLGHFQMDETDAMSERLFAEGTATRRSYRIFESSWQEQRNYIYSAIEALDADKRREATEELAVLEPDSRLLLDGSICANEDKADVHRAAIDALTPYRLGCFTVEFGTDGSIIALVDAKGKRWADERHRLGVVRYESFGVENYNTWFEQYMENLDKTHAWSDADYNKPGMEHVCPKPRHMLYEPKPAVLSLRREDDADRVYARMSMPGEAVEQFGAPANFWLEYAFERKRPTIRVTLHWFGKQANRLPEATWFSFSPMVDNPNLWKMDKLGELISPLEVVKDGNRNLHAVNTGMHYYGADGRAFIETLDAPLVSPGERRLLQFDNTFAPLDGGFHFVLHNNIWGTNFPMWYEDDATFRFNLILGL